MASVESDVKFLCRLCAQSADAHHNVFFYDDQIDLVAAIHNFLSIKISPDDVLPVCVCRNCRGKIVDFNEFYYKSVQTQDLLSRRVNGDLTKVVKLELTENAVEFDSEPFRRGDALKDEDSSHHADDDRDSDYDNEDSVPISEILVKERNKRKLPTDAETPTAKRLSKGHAKIEKSERSSVDEDESKDEESDKNGLRKKRRMLMKNSFVKFICHVCKSNFSNWFALRTHVKQNHNERAKVLCLCQKYLYTRHSINRHIIKHDTTLGLKCTTCDKTFCNEKALEAHSVIHLSKDQYPHVCSHCAKRFATLLTLKAHERTHLPKELRYIHNCDVCNIKFPSKSSLKAHISAVHEKLRPYICDICGHAFYNKGNLLDHRVLHSDEKMHNCPKCPKKFKTKGTLQRHIDCHKDTSYQCPECPAILNSRRTLKTHMFVHEEFCRYICSFCNKGYKRRKTLKSHMHLHTGERPYSCLWCPKTFADSSNCRIHKRRMHPNELIEYEAIHGSGLSVVERDSEGKEKKVIYNVRFKFPERKIFMPQLDIKPCVPELLDENDD